MNEQLIKDAQDRLKDWEIRSSIWYFIYYALGILATAFVITAAAKPPQIELLGGEATVLWLAALFQGLNTYLLTLQKGASYRSAWRILKFAVIDYMSSTTPDPKAVSEAIKAGWQMIDKGYSGGKDS